MFHIFFVFLSAQQPTDTLRPENANLEFLSEITLDQINFFRNSKARARPLVMRAQLRDAARHHTQYLMQNNILTHEQKDKKMQYFYQRIAYFDTLSHKSSGENVLCIGGFNGGCTYLSAAREMAKTWYSSTGHRKNMLNRQFSRTGIAISWNQRSKQLHAVQVFTGN